MSLWADELRIYYSNVYGIISFAPLNILASILPCISVTETEVRDGLVDIEDQEKHCLWLKRDIDDIENQEKNYQLSRYIGKFFTLLILRNASPRSTKRPCLFFENNIMQSNFSGSNTFGTM